MLPGNLDLNQVRTLTLRSMIFAAVVQPGLRKV